MDENQFSRETQIYLKRGGWFPGRSVDTNAVVSQLEAWGYVVPPVVKTFLKKFYGVLIEFPGPHPKLPEYLSIDPLDRGKAYSPSRNPKDRAALIKYLGTFPCHIGWYGTDRWNNLFMDAQGNVYVANVDIEYIDFIGRSVKFAIENVIGTLSRSQKFLYKRFAPYNEDRLYEILVGNPKFASMTYENPLPSYQIDTVTKINSFLRENGHTVYTVNGDVDEAIKVLAHGYK